MKELMKRIVFVACFVILLPVFLAYIVVSRMISDKDTAIASFAQFLSLFPGKTGNYLRAVFFHYTLSNCNMEVVISFNTLFSQQDTELGKGAYIGPQSNIGRCSIGDNTLLGSGVHVMSGKNQHFIDDLNKPIKDQGGELEKIVIGQNCWIGNCSLIMARVGNHSIIGAGSVVVNDIPDYAIAVGNPAKIIKYRK